MPRKKNVTKKKISRGSKGEFVRSLPESLSAKEVVAEAAKNGIVLTDAYVYKIRRGGGSEGKAGKPKQKRAERAGSATAFVRSLPADISAKDAVERAKAAGIKLTTGYFYTLKSSLGLVGAKRGRPVGSKNAVKVKGKPGPKPKASQGGLNGLALSSKNPHEQAVIDAVNSLGLARVRSVMDALQRLGA